VSLRVEGFSRRPLDKFGGGVAATMSMDFFPEPEEERRVVAGLDGVGEGGKVSVGGLPKVGCGEIAERVGGKVTESTQRPVDILKTSVGIVGNVEAKELLEKFVPRGRKVANGKISLEELGFQFETKKDVEVVCDFVRFHADERALHGV
jgi:hypothetical protein